ncbi:MAG TPA: FAD-binding oxidoreductase [Candidatus Rifleibacterium sp.]|jgi:sarcosine oxidase subunit beta|nr:FAD-binding oxidoreductase [Candidatus Rifleibacterium sp.]
MNRAFDAVIIGGGILGISTAYELARAGMKNICVLERKYLASGSTGRCGGGFRQQWSTEANTTLAMASVQRLEGLEEELGYRTEFFQGGYLILAHTEEEEQQFAKNVAMQRKLGLEVDMVDPDEARKIVPFLNTEMIRKATWCPKDGHINPFLLTQGYANAAKRLGVEIHLWTNVTGIMKKSNVFFVMTENGNTYQTPLLFNCAGGFSKGIGQMLNVDIPVDPYRHEILVTEPVERLWNPMVISFSVGLYARQEMSGGVVMGMGDPNEPVGTYVGSSMHFMYEMSKRFSQLFPKLDKLRIVRQWAGLYEMTADAQPVLGPVDEVDNFIQASGFSGHGLMLAPAVSMLLADLVVNKKKSPVIDDLNVKRLYNLKDVVKEKSVV